MCLNTLMVSGCVGATVSKGNHGIARTTRPCPFCGRTIHKGEPIGKSREGWVHEDCVLGVHQHIREVWRLSGEYRARVVESLPTNARPSR